MPELSREERALLRATIAAKIRQLRDPARRLTEEDFRFISRFGLLGEGGALNRELLSGPELVDVIFQAIEKDLAAGRRNEIRERPPEHKRPK